MLNELTTQQFFDILTKFQSELCGQVCAVSMLASILGTLLYWFICDVLKSLYNKLFLKGREKNEEK